MLDALEQVLVDRLAALDRLVELGKRRDEARHQLRFGVGGGRIGDGRIGRVRCLQRDGEAGLAGGRGRGLAQLGQRRPDIAARKVRGRLDDIEQRGKSVTLTGRGFADIAQSGGDRCRDLGGSNAD